MNIKEVIRQTNLPAHCVPFVLFVVLHGLELGGRPKGVGNRKGVPRTDHTADRQTD